MKLLVPSSPLFVDERQCRRPFLSSETALSPSRRFHSAATPFVVLTWLPAIPTRRVILPLFTALVFAQKWNAFFFFQRIFVLTPAGYSDFGTGRSVYFRLHKSVLSGSGRSDGPPAQETYCRFPPPDVRRRIRFSSLKVITRWTFAFWRFLLPRTLFPSSFFYFPFGEGVLAHFFRGV